MPRTKAVATPGTTQAAADEGTGPAAQDGAEQSALPTAEAVTLADAMAQIAELKSMVKTLGRNQAAQAGGEKVELPELEAVMAQKPTIPMLTKQGWYVPAVHPTDRLAKV